MWRVLIVDDEDSFRVPLATQLTMAGHDVRTAANGEEAIAQAAADCPDLLVVDWMLKNHLTGIEVARALLAYNPKLRTILVSGFPSPALEGSVGEAGIQAFLTKPCSFQEVEAALAKVAAVG